jgi:hypothetical protein
VVESVPRVLPDHLVARVEACGLIVSGPWQEEASGWPGRFVIARSGEDIGGIRLLKPPVVWLYEENGAWVAHKHEMIPGPGPTDFRSTHATAEEALERILHFFSSATVDAEDGRNVG